MTLETQLRVGRNLTALRKSINMTKSAIAREIIISRSTYCQYEQGERLPDLNTLYTLAEFYHVKVDTLINSDVDTVLADHFLREDFTHEQEKLLEHYSRLSDFSKGKLMAKVEELVEADEILRREALATF